MAIHRDGDTRHVATLTFPKRLPGFRYLSELGIAMVMPDTSPRGHPEIPTENDSWDFGTGAGFYLNATKDGWSKNYNM